MTFTIAEARAAAERARSHQRPQLLTGLYGKLAGHLWLRLVGEFWTRCDGDREALTRLMRTYSDWAELIASPRERILLRTLPEQMILWRGCYRGLNEDGLSYSVDSEGARQYPLRGRYRRDDAEAVVVRALVDRSQCVVKVDCGVMEVLVREVVSKTVYPLGAQLPKDQYDILDPVKPPRCWPGLCLRVSH